MNGMWTGMGVGAVSRALGGYATAKKAGINPCNGKPNKSITIGEGMDRVNLYARNYSMEIVKITINRSVFYELKNSLPPGIEIPNRTYLNSMSGTEYVIYNQQLRIYIIRLLKTN